jgi:hypothetical protein
VHEEFAKSTSVWVILPRLPMDLWSNLDLEKIGNTLCRFILSYDFYKSSNAQSVVNILVDIDLSSSLYESIEIEVGSLHYTQTLDYENIPFRCIQCH